MVDQEIRWKMNEPALPEHAETDGMKRPFSTFRFLPFTSQLLIEALIFFDKCLELIGNFNPEVHLAKTGFP